MAYQSFSGYADVAVDVEQWLREAASEATTAMKRTEPDDIDYWETIKDFDVAGQNANRDLTQETD